MIDPEFSQEGVQTLRRGARLHIFKKNCTKLRKSWSLQDTSWVHPKDLLLICLTFNICIHIHIHIHIWLPGRLQETHKGIYQGYWEQAVYTTNEGIHQWSHLQNTVQGETNNIKLFPETTTDTEPAIKETRRVYPINAWKITDEVGTMDYEEECKNIEDIDWLTFISNNINY